MFAGKNAWYMNKALQYNFFRRYLFTALMGLSLSLFTVPSQADYIHPGDVKVQTVVYKPGAGELTSGTYHYKVTWQGVPVADAEIEVYPVSSPSSPVRVVARTKTKGLVAAFYKMKHHSESMFERGTFRPVHFSSNQKERRKEKFREVDFKRDGLVRSARWREGRAKTVQEFRPENPLFDPISAAFLAKSLDLSVGKKVSFDVFNGKHRYLIDFEVEKLERIKVKGQSVEAFKVVPSVQKLTDTEGEKKLKSAALWITADDRREILKVSSSVYIGSVVAKFDKFVASSGGMLEAHSGDDRARARASLGDPR